LTTVFPSSVEDDFYGWLLDQAAALRGQRFSSLDWKNLGEELQAAAFSLEQGLENDLETLLTHLLQWQCQPKRRSRNWQAVIQNARSNINDQLVDSPRLAARLRKAISGAYRKARRSAGAAMGLSESQWEGRFPRDCPWDISSLRRSDFWPDNHADYQSAG